MIPEPGSVASAVSTQAYRSSGPSPSTTDSRSDERARPPRNTTVASPSCVATSAVTRAFAVAVVASTGVPGALVSTFESRW